MLFDHLNLAYLGAFSRGFYQVKALVDKRGEQGITDHHLLAKCFEANVDRSVFQNRTDLATFVRALDETTQEKLTHELRVPVAKATLLDLQQGLKALGLPDEFLHAANSAPPHIHSKYYSPVPSAPELYGYQKAVFQEALDFLGPPHGRCIIQMPTGAGKTRTALQVVFDFLNQGQSVLWLANTEELIEQCVQSFDELWPGQCRQASWVINHVGQAYEPTGEKPVAFHLATIQSIARNAGKKVDAFESHGHQISLVVIDEAHISLAPKYKEALEAFCFHKGRRLLGLSATPGRGANRAKENAALARFFHQNLVKLTPPPPHDTALSFLQSEGVLAKPTYFPLEIEWAEELIEQFYEEYGHAASEQELTSWIGNNESRNSLILEKLLKLCRQGKQIIYFGTSVQQSELMAAMLRLEDIPSASISAQTKGRRSLIAQFKSGQIQVLCNYGVLSTGFDAPQTDVVFIARPTSSIILYHQMIGRGLRGPKFGGSEHCEVVTVLDNLEGLVSSEQILDYFDGHFEVSV